MESKEIKRLCILKWEDLAKTGNKDPSSKVMKEIEGLLAHCALCEKYILQRAPKSLNCSECPLNTRGHNCFTPVSFYSKWGQQAFKIMRKYYAKQLLKLLESIPEEEY